MTDIDKAIPDDEVKLEGTVKYVAVAKDGKTPVLKGAKVSAFNDGLGTTQTATTDENGHYVIDRLRKGKWEFSVSAPDYQTVVGDEQKIEGSQESKDFLLYPECVISDGTIDLVRGQRFFYQLILILFILIVTYLTSHYVIHVSGNHTQQAIRGVVQETVVILQEKGDNFTKDQIVKLQNLVSYLAANVNQPLVINTLSTEEKEHFKNAVELMVALSSGLKNEDNNDVSEVKEDADKALTGMKQAKYAKELAALTILQKDLERRILQTGYLWNEMPWRLLEILFWATAGVLANKIMTTGYYMRKRLFYREGIIMHYSHLFAVPIMVLVVVLLLSIFSIQFVFQGDTKLELNLNNPVMLVSVSFLLASVPWAIRDFLTEKAGNVLGRNVPGEKGE